MAVLVHVDICLGLFRFNLVQADHGFFIVICLLSFYLVLFRSSVFSFDRYVSPPHRALQKKQVINDICCL